MIFPVSLRYRNPWKVLLRRSNLDYYILDISALLLLEEILVIVIESLDLILRNSDSSIS